MTKKFERDVEGSLFELNGQVQAMVKDCGRKPNELAEAMGVNPQMMDVLLEGNFHSLHLRTLVRFCHACGFKVAVSLEPIEEKPKRKRTVRKATEEKRVVKRGKKK